MASHRDVQAYLETAPRCQTGNCEVQNGKGKRSYQKDQVRIGKMNENEPSMKCRETEHSVKTTGPSTLGDLSAAGTCLLAAWQTA